MRNGRIQKRGPFASGHAHCLPRWFPGVHVTFVGLEQNWGGTCEMSLPVREGCLLCTKLKPRFRSAAGRLASTE